MKQTLSHFGIALVVAAMLFPRASHAYIEAPHSLGKIVGDSGNIVVLKVEKVDKERNIIVYSKVRDIKGTHPTNVVRHVIQNKGFHEREQRFVMDWAEPGKIAVFCYKDGASETCIDTYWYQCYGGGDTWNHNHGEPYLLRSFAGKPEKLIGVVEQMLAGQEVIVPAMRDGDKNALQLRTAKLQRMKVSLKLQDYNQDRDFAGWGGDEFRALAGMPGFSMFGTIGRLGGPVNGIATADIDGDKQADVCLYSEEKTMLLKSAGRSMEEVSLPYAGGARGASFADWNGDGKVDLLLATPTGPRLFTNTGGAFRDETSALPREAYYNLTAAAFVDYDLDGKQDVLLANGFLGLRLYRNRAGQPAPAPTTPLLGKWHYIGPFDNEGGKGFARAYPPEAEIELKKAYKGKTQQVTWKEGNFADGQVNSLALFDQSDSCTAYVYREIEVAAATQMPVSLGSDDSLVAFLNGQKVAEANEQRACAADQHQVVLQLKPGKNRLLLKIGNGSGDWAFYFQAKATTASVPAQFEDVSDKLGLGLAGAGGSVKGDRLLVADFNGDLRPDFLYVGAAPMLAINTPNGFVEKKDHGLNFKGGRITPAIGDFNGDKTIDLFVPMAKGPSKLYRNDGTGRFADVTPQSGDLAKPIPNAVGAVFVDFGKSGKQDILIACNRGPNHYLKNNGNGTFTDASEALGLTTKVFGSRLLAAADINKDGTLDLVLANEGQESAALVGNPNRK